MASSEVIGQFTVVTAVEVARQAPRIRHRSRYVFGSFRRGTTRVDRLLAYERGYVQFIISGRGFGGLPRG